MQALTLCSAGSLAQLGERMHSPGVKGGSRCKLRPDQKVQKQGLPPCTGGGHVWAL
jgi:hypothetical protein